jgi:hypothetical protein
VLDVMQTNGEEEETDELIGVRRWGSVSSQKRLIERGMEEEERKETASYDEGDPERGERRL